MGKIYTWNDLNEIADELNKKTTAAVIETDTVMGIISHSENLIYKIKQRPKEKKIVTFVNDIDLIKSLTEKEKNAIKDFWPGALTIVKGGLSYRIPNHKQVLKLLEKTGPMLCSSANISGHTTCIDSDDAQKVFKDVGDELFFVEGKNLTNNPSTVLDLDNLKVLRSGPVDGEKIIQKICKE